MQQTSAPRSPPPPPPPPPPPAPPAPAPPPHSTKQATQIYSEPNAERVHPEKVRPAKKPWWVQDLREIFGSASKAPHVHQAQPPSNGESSAASSRESKDRRHPASERFRDSRERARKEWERAKKDAEQHAEEAHREQEHQKRRQEQERSQRKRRQEQEFWDEQSKRQKERPRSSRKPDVDSKNSKHSAGNTGNSGNEGTDKSGRNETAPPSRKQSDKRGVYLELLGFGLDDQPSEQDLKKSYRAMAMKWHPDRPHNREHAAEATEKFQVAKDAFEYFMEEHRRKI